MKVTQKFFKNNFILLIVGLDIFYTVLFFILFLWGTGNTLTLSSVLDTINDSFAFILILIHPILLAIIIFLNTRDNNKFNLKLNEQIETQNKKIEEVSTFVDQLRQGQSNFKFSADFQQDKLVRLLQNMRDDIEKNRKEDKLRQIEEQQRHWVNEGLAKFGAILRESVENLEELASNVTSSLTKYINSQQAGFFIVNEKEEENDERNIEMIALFAYDRKKFPDKKLKWGEGLIGACIIEQKTIFIKETSDTFVNITSGLGKANPRAILIVPIKDSENVVHGAIELASFKVFEKYEISFVEQIAESIGLTIATIKTGLRTRSLLTESQKQAEMLAQQDETMRVNIEEIEEEREKSEKRAEEFEIFSNSVNQAIIRVDINTEGNIVYANDIFLQIFNYKSQENIINQKFSNLITNNFKDRYNKSFNQIIETQQKYHFGIEMIASTGKHLWIESAFVPILDTNKNLNRIMFLAADRTDIQTQTIIYKQNLHSFSKIALNANFKLNGAFIEASQNFQDTIGINKDKLDEKTIFDLIPENQIENFKIIWANLSKGQEYKTEQILVSKDNEKIVTQAYFSPIKNIDGEVQHIAFVAIDITEQINSKNTLLETNKQINIIKNELKNEKKNITKKIENERIINEKKYKNITFKANIFENLFQTLDSGIVVIENDTIIAFNKIAEELWGFKEEIVLGKKTKYLFSGTPVIKEDKLFLGNLISQNIEKNIEEKQMYILDRNQEKKEVFVKIIFFEIEDKTYLSVFLKQIK